MIRVIAIGAAAGALLLAGCSDDDDDGGSGTTVPATSAATTTETAPPPAATGTRIKASNSDYGLILFDGDDQAIYLFDKDTGPTSECYGDCAEAWPPVLTEGKPQAGAEVDQSLLGTTARNDGTTQVTFNGHPLYYYLDDPAGEVLCQNIEEFGGLWVVVKPKGEPVRG